MVKMSMDSVLALETLGKEIFKRAVTELHEKGQSLVPEWERRNFIGVLAAQGLCMVQEECGAPPLLFANAVSRASRLVLEKGSDQKYIDLDEIAAQIGVSDGL